MSLDDIMKRQPSGGGEVVEENDLGYLGMPKGYVAKRPVTPYTGGRMSPTQAERRGPGNIEITPPKYQIGSEMEPRGFSPENIARLQQQMVNAGLISGKYRLGVWDSTSVSAYKGLLSYANQGGLDKDSALRELAASPKLDPDDMGGGAGGGAGTSPEELARKRRALEASFNTQLHTYDRSDPAGVRQTAEAAFRQALGRKPRKQEMEKFTQAFLGQERSGQAAIFGAQDNLANQDRKRALGSFDAEATAALAPPGGEGGPESEVLWQRLQKMIADAPGRITPGPRERSYEEQVRLYNKYKAGKGAMAAKPGRSKHGDGRANDLRYENDKVRQWALANASKYGLAFPIYNPKLGRGRDESWHIELAAGTANSMSPRGASAPMGPGAPQISQTVINQRQDAGAQAIEFARNSNPTETKAYDIGQQFNSFLSILNRGVM